jgi:hypothetical protein
LAGSVDEAVFDKLLLGTWLQPAQGCAVSFTRFGDEKTYRVVYSASKDGKDCLLNDGHSASFTGTLVEIGSLRFLDVSPADREEMHHMLLTHSFYRVRVDATALQLTPLNFDWVQSQVQQDKLGLAGATRADSTLVLTSSTRQLRDFLRQYGGSDEAFSHGRRMDFERKTEP